jgi:hypothetical protein
VTKIGFQLKQVRERLAKGLVDKGVLRTEKRNFLLFDMATHPVADSGAKDAVLRRVLTLLTSRSGTLPSPGSLYRDEGKAVSAPATRSLALLCCAFSANVLENALTHLAYDAREAAFQKADDLLADFAQWPMAPRSGAAIGSNVAGPAGGARKPGIGEGSMSTEAQGAGVSTAELAKAVRAELVRGDAGEAQFETIAAVLHVLSRMDSLVSALSCRRRYVIADCRLSPPALRTQDASRADVDLLTSHVLVCQRHPSDSSCLPALPTPLHRLQSLPKSTSLRVRAVMLQRPERTYSGENSEAADDH